MRAQGVIHDALVARRCAPKASFMMPW